MTHEQRDAENVPKAIKCPSSPLPNLHTFFFHREWENSLEKRHCCCCLRSLFSPVASLFFFARARARFQVQETLPRMKRPLKWLYIINQTKTSERGEPERWRSWSGAQWLGPVSLCPAAVPFHYGHFIHMPFLKCYEGGQHPCRMIRIRTAIQIKRRWAVSDSIFHSDLRQGKTYRRTFDPWNFSNRFGFGQDKHKDKTSSTI